MKSLKRLTVLACLSLFLLTPISALANTPSVYHDPDQRFKYFEYATPLIVYNGRMEWLLNDTNNGNWTLAAGEYLYYYANFVNNAKVTVKLHKVSGSAKIVYEETYSDCNGIGNGIYISEAGNYKLCIIPDSSNTIRLTDYTFWIQ